LIRKEDGTLEGLEPVLAMAAERAVNLPIWRAALALLHAELGQTDAALEVLTDLGTGGFGNLPRVGAVLGAYAGLAEACALVDAPRFAEALLPLIVPYVDAVIVLANTAGCLGSAARYAGLLAHMLGRLDEAIAHFEMALGTNERIGAVPQLAHTQRELARSLRARGKGADRERAAGLDAAAAATAARLGLVGLQRRLAADDAAPRAVAVPPPASGPAHRTARLRHEGDVWTLACEAEVIRLKDMKGVLYLRELLRHPGHEF